MFEMVVDIKGVDMVACVSLAFFEFCKSEDLPHLNLFVGNRTLPLLTRETKLWP